MQNRVAELEQSLRAQAIAAEAASTRIAELQATNAAQLRQLKEVRHCCSCILHVRCCIFIYIVLPELISELISDQIWRHVPLARQYRSIV